MTRDEFKNIVKAIRGTYPNCPISSQQVFDLWYEMISDMDYAEVSGNLQNHIRNNRYAPTVAELRGSVDTKDFNNFQRRRYNMNELELQLLEAQRRGIKRIEENQGGYIDGNASIYENANRSY